MSDEPVEPVKRKPGRQPKVPKPTSAQMEEVLKAIAQGCADRECFRLLGIHERNWYRWMEMGEQGKEPYRQFRQQIETAKAELLRRCSATVVRAIAGRTIEVHPRTRNFPDGRVETIQAGRTIHEPGDAELALKLLRIKSPDWRDVSVIGKVPDGQDPNGPLTAAEAAVFRLLTGGGKE